MARFLGSDVQQRSVKYPLTSKRMFYHCLISHLRTLTYFFSGTPFLCLALLATTVGSRSVVPSYKICHAYASLFNSDAVPRLSLRRHSDRAKTQRNPRRDVETRGESIIVQSGKSPRMRHGSSFMMGSTAPPRVAGTSTTVAVYVRVWRCRRFRAREAIPG